MMTMELDIFWQPKGQELGFKKRWWNCYKRHTSDHINRLFIYLWIDIGLDGLVFWFRYDWFTNNYIDE